MVLPGMLVDQEQKARMQVLAGIRKNLESQLKPLKKNSRSIVNLLNS